MPPNSQNDFVLELIRDAIRRLEEVSDKVDARIDSLEQRMAVEHKDLLTVFSNRMHDIEDQVDANTTKLMKHEHNFNMATYLFTGGMATVVSWFTWLGNVFQNKPPHP